MPAIPTNHVAPDDAYWDHIKGSPTVSLTTAGRCVATGVSSDLGPVELLLQTAVKIDPKSPLFHPPLHMSFNCMILIAESAF